MYETRSWPVLIAIASLLWLVPAGALAEGDGEDQRPAEPAVEDGEADEEAESGTAAGSEVDEPVSSASDPEPDDALRSTALLFFQALIAGVPEAIVELSAYPFLLDGEPVANRAELGSRLRQAFRMADLSRIPFYGMRSYPADRMLEVFGPPPERLEELDLEDAWVVVANLGGHGHIAVFKRQNGVWRATAYSE